MNIEELEKAIKLMKVLDSCKKEADAYVEYGKYICILQRGWVFVGDLFRSENECVLKNASVVRIWGTTNGLGEIAENGPIKDKTILDKCPDVRFHYLTTVASIKCNEDKWK